MAAPAKPSPPGHGDDWPGPDLRRWTQTTLFDSTFLGDGCRLLHLPVAPELSPSLIDVPFPLPETTKRPRVSQNAREVRPRVDKT